MPAILSVLLIAAAAVLCWRMAKQLEAKRRKKAAGDEGCLEYRTALAFDECLDALAARCGKLKVVYVLSDEEQPGCEKGFVSAALMERYTSLEGSTFFLCGPQAMYEFVEKELAPLGLPQKAVHRDAGCCGDLPLERPGEYKLTVHMRDEVFEIPAKENETLLTPTSAAPAAAASATASGSPAVTGWRRAATAAGKRTASSASSTPA